MRIAAVQAAPVFLDRERSVLKAADLIREAGANGASLLGFPEGFIPGHPGWGELQVFDAHSQDLGQRLFEQAVEVEGDDLRPIQDACAAAKVTVVLGICERRPRTTGTLYNTQVHIGADGKIQSHHQKFVPTVGERLWHAPGHTGLSLSSAWAGGRVSSLICGENSHPLAVYACARDYPNVHVASWPQHFSPELGMREPIRLVSRGVAYSMKCFVLNAVTTVSEEMIELYGHNKVADYLRDAETSGRASIIAPNGSVITEAADDSEQIVSADIDPGAVTIPKMFHDVVGHYNRPDIYSGLFESPTSDGAASG